MIPVSRPDEPRVFDAKVRKPGGRWRSEHRSAKRPRAFWSECLDPLREAFSGRCGYAAMLDPTGGTVDHYLSWKNHPELAYEWSNYRFASAVMNSAKRTADAAVLDPFDVGAGWFEIILPSLQMQITDAVPPELREKAEYTLKRLKLRDGERVIRWRLSWYRLFLNGGVSLEGLRDVAPLLAEAIDKDRQRVR